MMPVIPDTVYYLALTNPHQMCGVRKTVSFTIALTTVVFFSAHAPAQTLTTLAAFNGTNGAVPQGSLTLSHDGTTLYGMSYCGGPYGDGTIFSLPVSGGPITVLASFDGTNGELPSGSLALSPDGSTLYGMNRLGGAGNQGVVFGVPALGGAITSLANFDYFHGSEPYGSLTLGVNGSTLYGMTPLGGAYTCGTIFNIATTGGPLVTLASLPYTGASGGSGARGDVTLSRDGLTLYGMTQYGGTNGKGMIFGVPAAGGPLTTLFSFGSDGAYPNASLTLSNDGSMLYGLTGLGGAYNKGTIFKIAIDGGIPETLASFSGTNGAYPTGSLTLSPDASILYGMTSQGGVNDLGTIFSIPVAGGALTNLAWFDGYPHGMNPHGSLTISQDGLTLYGIASGGGTYGDGSIFALTIPEPSAFALLAVGGVCLLAYVWQRRKLHRVWSR